MVTLFCFVYRLTTNRSSYAIVFGYKRVPFKYLWLRSFRFLFSYFIRGRILFMRGECRRSVTNDRTAALEELAYQDVDITVSTLRVCVWGGGCCRCTRSPTPIRGPPPDFRLTAQLTPVTLVGHSKAAPSVENY